MYGLLFATPLAFVGLALTFARWAYKRSDPYESVVIAVAILSLTAMTVVTAFSLQAQRNRYEALRERHFEVVTRQAPADVPAAPATGSNPED